MSTNVFWAGRLGGGPVVSIFNNPTGQQGSNVPLTNPIPNLSRIYFDSRFDYLEVISTVNFTHFYNQFETNTSLTKKGKTGSSAPIDGFTTTVIFNHNFGYVPTCLLVDVNSKEVITGNHFIQNINNNSFRIISLITDTTNISIREKYFVRVNTLPSLTRQYKLLVFDNRADMPSF